MAKDMGQGGSRRAGLGVYVTGAIAGALLTALAGIGAREVWEKYFFRNDLREPWARSILEEGGYRPVQPGYVEPTEGYIIGSVTERGGKFRNDMPLLISSREYTDRRFSIVVKPRAEYMTKLQEYKEIRITIPEASLFDAVVPLQGEPLEQPVAEEPASIEFRITGVRHDGTKELLYEVRRRDIEVH